MDYVGAAANLRAYMFGIKGKIFIKLIVVGISIRNNKSQPLLSPVTALLFDCKLQQTIRLSFTFQWLTFFLSVCFSSLIGSRDQKLILDSLKTVKVATFKPKSGKLLVSRGFIFKEYQSVWTNPVCCCCFLFVRRDVLYLHIFSVHNAINLEDINSTDTWLHET